MTKKSTLFLLDGMALAYRAHFAFISSRLTNQEGIPTGPILGFANTLDKLLEEEKPTHIAVAWDTHAPTFRHEIDPQYKANRPPQPDDLRVGIPLIKEMVAAYGIQNLELDGYEADDIIGTLASKAEKEHVDAWMVTPDKDYMQLVHDHIQMIKPDNANGGFIRVGREEVKEYFGVYPEQVVDVLAIIGDTSDNIPGVPGIGKKGAPELITRFGSLESTIANADQISAKKQREGLQLHAEAAMRAKTMVTIKTDVPGIPNWRELVWEGADKKALGAFFTRMSFRTLSRKYGEDGVGVVASPAAAAAGGAGARAASAGAAGTPDLFSAGAGSTGAGSGPTSQTSTSIPTSPTSNKTSSSEANSQMTLSMDPSQDASLQRLADRKVAYHLVDSQKALRELVNRLAGESRICIDTETDDADPMLAKLAGISLSVSQAEAWYVPVDVEDGLPKDQVVAELGPLLSDPERHWVAHNAKYDWLVLERAGLPVKGSWFDTMIGAYLIDTSQRLKMDDLSIHYLGYLPIPISDLIGKGKEQVSIPELPASKVKDYACEDADVTLQLADKIQPELERDELVGIAEKVDFPLIPVLGRMEKHGVLIDQDMLGAFSKDLTEDMNRLEEDIFAKAGQQFNIQSPKQLGEILFDKLGLPSGKKTRTGQVSTSEDVLSELSHLHPVPGLILDYRSLAKLKSTYADALPALVNPNTGRVHTSYNQTVAATGRLSSSNPNLQNIPIRTQRGREIRKAFIAQEGYSLLAADYSQVELRIIAAISGDENMIKAFQNNEDIHARTAMEIFGLEDSTQVTSDHRRKAKEVNFGIPYGVSAFGLASRLGIGRKEGKEMIDRYFDRFPGVKTYIDETIRFANEHGYVKTLLGRRRNIPDIRSGNWSARGFAERTAINMPIQGTAADIIKLAMIRIDQELRAIDSRSRMILQVHDELVFEIHESEKESLPSKIREWMSTAYELTVPLSVEMGLAGNWLDAH